MRTKLLLLAAGVLASPIAAHAATPTSPPLGFCTNASPMAIWVINLLLTIAGLPTC
jgi:hypothetical protein